MILFFTHKTLRFLVDSYFYFVYNRYRCLKTVRPSLSTKKYAPTVTRYPSSRNGLAPSPNPASACSTRASGPDTICIGSRYLLAHTTTRCTTRDWAGRVKWTKWLRYVYTQPSLWSIIIIMIYVGISRVRICIRQSTFIYILLVIILIK